MIKNYIDEQVLYTQTKYDERVRNCKKIFIKGLANEIQPKTIAGKFAKQLMIDHTFMDQVINELETRVKAKDGTTFEFKKTLPNKFEMIPIEEFEKNEKAYYDRLNKYYESRLETTKNIADKETYLTKQIDKFDNIEKYITYYHHGMPWSKQKLSTYNSMLFNVNLTRAGWNQTYKDSIILDIDLMQFAMHPNSCPVCAEHQGITYSIHGTTKGYPSVDEALADGVGHPNCKCEWILQWDEQIQVEQAPNTEEEYEFDQHQKALERYKLDLETDLELYSYIGNGEKVDKTLQKLDKIDQQLV